VRRYGSVFACLWLLGCQAPASATAPPVSAPPRATATAIPTAPALPAAPGPFVLRYVCDDKYDEGATCRPGKPGWDAWLGNVDLSVTTQNLLNHQGGGPSGAEWNPEAPLVAFVASAEAGHARLASSKATFEPVARFRDYDVFLVPPEAWNAAVRAARPDDFPVGAELAPISVVELRAIGGKAELARGTFAFSRGE
jgi:hypothetical protein